MAPSNPLMRTTLVGAIVNFFLVIIQAVGGLLFRSPALVADALHTATDLASDAIVAAGARLGQEPPDEGHPYGHGKFETMAQLLIAGLMMATGITFTINVYGDLIDPHLAAPQAIWIAALTLIAKEGLYRYTSLHARALDNRLLATNAWHHRTDAISSLGVLLSLLGAQMGFPFLDPLAGFLISAAIFFTGINFARKAVNDLVEGSIEKSLVADIERIAAAQTGVRRVHDVRARRVGSRILVDLHVLVNGHTSVSDGHQIAVRVSRAIREGVRSIEDVLVHIDPEDDEEHPTQLQRSSSEIEADVKNALTDIPGLLSVSHLTVHYLKGRTNVSLEIEVDMGQTLQQAAAIATATRRAIVQVDGADEVDVHLEIDDRT